jgi:hypothetical protein
MTPSSCGEGLAEHSSFPTALAELLEAMATMLAVHTDALDPIEENAQAEHRAYRVLIDQHRQASDLLSKMGRQMATCRDLPPAKHDPEAASSRRVLEAFETVVKHEREILALLEKRVQEHQRMLVELVAAG